MSRCILLLFLFVPQSSLQKKPKGSGLKLVSIDLNAFHTYYFHNSFCFLPIVCFNYKGCWHYLFKIMLCIITTGCPWVCSVTSNSPFCLVCFWSLCTDNAHQTIKSFVCIIYWPFSRIINKANFCNKFLHNCSFLFGFLTQQNQ